MLIDCELHGVNTISVAIMVQVNVESARTCVNATAKAVRKTITELNRRSAS